MTHEQLWEAYTALHPEETGKAYEAWCYGSTMPDELARLTVEGTKTATASAYPEYEYEHCPLPKPGDCDIILNTAGEALCVIRTTGVDVVPFLQVDEQQAYREGEGDRSLAFWRKVHTQAFSAELAEIGLQFSEDMLVVCQKFEVVYKA